MRKKYPLASFFRRSISRLLDFVLLIGIFIGLYFIIFGLGELDVVFKANLFFLFMFLIFFISFLYFIILPFFWRGKTIFIWLFKMKIYNINYLNYKIFTKNNSFKKIFHILLSLIKKDLFIWVILSFINIVLAIVVFSLGDKEGLVFLRSLFFSNFGSSKLPNFNPYATIFTSLYSINYLILFFLIINFFLNSNKRNIIDIYSSTITLYLKEINKIDEEISSNKNKVNNKLPLEILDSVFEEIDDLKEKNE